MQWENSWTCRLFMAPELPIEVSLCQEQFLRFPLQQKWCRAAGSVNWLVRLHQGCPRRTRRKRQHATQRGFPFLCVMRTFATLTDFLKIDRFNVSVSSCCDFYGLEAGGLFTWSYRSVTVPCWNEFPTCLLQKEERLPSFIFITTQPGMVWLCVIFMGHKCNKGRDGPFRKWTSAGKRWSLGSGLFCITQVLTRICQIFQPKDANNEGCSDQSWTLTKSFSPASNLLHENQNPCFVHKETPFQLFALQSFLMHFHISHAIVPVVVQACKCKWASETRHAIVLCTASLPDSYVFLRVLMHVYVDFWHWHLQFIRNGCVASSSHWSCVGECDDWVALVTVSRRWWDNTIAVYQEMWRHDRVYVCTNVCRYMSVYYDVRE